MENIKFLYYQVFDVFDLTVCKMEISLTNCKINYEIFHRIKEERKLVHITKRRKANWLVTSCVGTAF